MTYHDDDVAIEAQAPIRDELPFSLNSTKRASTYVRRKYLLEQLGENVLTSIVMGNKVTRRCATVDERYTRPQGLYPQRGVDQKKLRRLILDSKLAPCFPGEDEANADFEECPICFLSYPSLNRSKCCSKGVCTECFLQMKSPRTARSIQCPFCKSYNYGVEYRGVKSLEEKGIEAAEEQKVIEAKIRMRKREILDDEQREQRKEEGCHASRATTDLLRNSRLLEPPQLTEMPPQVKLTPDLEKWKQNLCEPNYCFDKPWLRKPCGPSLTAGPSSFRTCDPYCEPNCVKCLMTFHKIRVYDVLDVITPTSESVLKEKRIEPFVGRWRSTWGVYHSPLSRSFPLPSRMPEYHCRHTRILDTSLDVPSHPAGLSNCEDQKTQKANDLAQESATSGMSDRPSPRDDLDSLRICEEYGSEGSLAPTPAPSAVTT